MSLAELMDGRVILTAPNQELCDYLVVMSVTDFGGIRATELVQPLAAPSIAPLASVASAAAPATSTVSRASGAAAPLAADMAADVKTAPTATVTAATATAATATATATATAAPQGPAPQGPVQGLLLVFGQAKAQTIAAAIEQIASKRKDKAAPKVVENSLWEHLLDAGTPVAQALADATGLPVLSVAEVFTTKATRSTFGQKRTERWIVIDHERAEEVIGPTLASCFAATL
jgi:hypothetical protein